MKKCIAFVFTSAPCGTVIPREACDLSLSASTLSDSIGIFFIADGIFLLLSNQTSSNQNFNHQIVYESFVFNFEILFLCGVRNLYMCADSAFERGIIKKQIRLIPNVIWLSSQDWREKLSCYNLVLSF